MTGYTRVGQNISGQFGMPLYGIGWDAAFTGNQFWVNETTGNDGNTGGPQDPLATLTQALSLCTNNNNDIIFLTGTVHVTATVAWSLSRTHLIGLAPLLDSQARARISQTGSTVFTPLVNVTGSECIFQNIGSFHGFNNASAQICWNDSGGRNQYFNCSFEGMGQATAAAQTGGRSLTITGPNGENTFHNCTIGLDTITRSAANASLELLSATPRNVFRNCVFPCLTSSASSLLINVGASAMDRWVILDNCSFMNCVDSTGTAITDAIAANASAGGSVLVQGGNSVGCTHIAASGVGPVYITNVLGASTSSIGLKAT